MLGYEPLQDVDGYGEVIALVGRCRGAGAGT
jgi:hypothetical protein